MMKAISRRQNLLFRTMELHLLSQRFRMFGHASCPKEANPLRRRVPYSRGHPPTLASRGPAAIRYVKSFSTKDHASLCKHLGPRSSDTPHNPTALPLPRAHMVTCE